MSNLGSFIYARVEGTDDFFIPVEVDSNGRLIVSTSPAQPTGYSFIDVTTANPGSNFTAYPSTTCTNLILLNYTDYAIDVKRNGTGSYITIPALQTYNFGGLTNANQISIRRNDQSNTQLTITSEVYTA